MASVPDRIALGRRETVFQAKTCPFPLSPSLLIMGNMPHSDATDLPSHFRQLLSDCQVLYVASGQLVAREFPGLLPESPEHFIRLMDDLHRALLVKIFVTICEADRRWSKNEHHLAEILLFHLWGQRLEGESLKAALLEISEKSLSLRWYTLVRPFDQIVPLRNHVGDLETVVMRLANIIARVDGPMRPDETQRVKMIQDELHVHLRPIPIDEADQHEQAHEARIETIKKILHGADTLPQAPPSPPAPSAPTEALPSAEPLQEALAELDRLVGLGNIKQEVRTLANFLKVQGEREKAGLPTTHLSLHMVFEGNPGTGKTTVARIVGKVLGAMGILEKGHLVETDRSGLVAEYSGQTGPKTNRQIDDALDGVLFIDEAYTLISAEGEDPYGNEAVQTLLKRMEDDRQRLVVILAGYPDEMQNLLRSNPGLSSRFSRHLDFIDYTPLELAQIFGKMCDKNHYHLRPLTRAKILVGLDYLYQNRDRYFGNGRTSRNLFEHAIRRMANRIAEIAELSLEQLTMLEAQDIEFKEVPTERFANLESLRFVITCPECEHGNDVPKKYLGQNVRCPKCQSDFEASWGALVVG